MSVYLFKITNFLSKQVQPISAFGATLSVHRSISASDFTIYATSLLRCPCSLWCWSTYSQWQPTRWNN